MHLPPLSTGQLFTQPVRSDVLISSSITGTSTSLSLCVCTLVRSILTARRSPRFLGSCFPCRTLCLTPCHHFVPLTVRRASRPTPPSPDPRSFIPSASLLPHPTMHLFDLPTDLAAFPSLGLPLHPVPSSLPHTFLCTRSVLPKLHPTTLLSASLRPCLQALRSAYSPMLSDLLLFRSACHPVPSFEFPFCILTPAFTVAHPVSGSRPPQDLGSFFTCLVLFPSVISASLRSSASLLRHALPLSSRSASSLS